VPVRGTLASLEARHDAFVSRIKDKTITVGLPATAYALVGYDTSAGLAKRPVAAFRIVDDRGRLELVPQRRLHVVAAMTRHAAIRAAERDRREPDWIRAFVAGHGDDEARKGERFSYLPLPSIGVAYSDGQVRRVLVAGPNGASPDVMRWANERLDGAALVDEATGEVRALLASQGRPDGVQRLYCGRGSRWTSATPVILPGHDDGRPPKARRLFDRALKYAGLREAVEDFELRRAPFWAGTRHAREYDVPSYLAAYSRWHAVLWFRRDVSGPLVVGAGRHVGFGLFAVADRP
jgi:CRISPR-associated protein Csb2